MSPVDGYCFTIQALGVQGICIIDLEFTFCTLGISLGLDCSVVEQLAGGAGIWQPPAPKVLGSFPLVERAKAMQTVLFIRDSIWRQRTCSPVHWA